MNEIIPVKHCYWCKEYFPVSQFYWEKSKNSYGGICKSCNKFKSREYRKKNPQYEKDQNIKSSWDRRVRHLHKKYGLGNEDYEKILKEQGGVCKICGGKDTKKHLDVDHCHETGQIRGLLCGNCNRALGYAKDNPETLRAMANYLESTNRPQVKGERPIRHCVDCGIPFPKGSSRRRCVSCKKTYKNETSKKRRMKNEN